MVLGSVTRVPSLRAAPWSRRTLRVRSTQGLGPPSENEDAAEALTRSLSELSKRQGRNAKSKNLIMGGATTESSWRELDRKVNSYPSQRMFTAIGSGGESFVDAMVAAVEHRLGPVHVECINQKTSSNGKYLSVTVGPVWVQSADQVVDIYARMKQDLRVKCADAAAMCGEPSDCTTTESNCATGYGFILTEFSELSEKGMTSFRLATRSTSVIYAKFGRVEQSRLSPRTRRRIRTAGRLSAYPRDKSSLKATLSQETLGNESKLLPAALDLQTLQASLREVHTYQNNATRLVRPRRSWLETADSEEVGCPVYVMLPLDTVAVIHRQGEEESQILKEKELRSALERFKCAGVHGVMIDVWWGIVERQGPKIYDFSAYKKLFEMIEEAGLKLQAVMSFHAAGSNVGDTCEIPLPKWVLEVGYKNPDVFYTDRQGHRNEEYLSLGCDEERVFRGRTPVEMYRDFVDAFANEFQPIFGDVITEVTVGLGPAGELRYPSYPEGDGRWSFPGVGEFQCYDAYMLASLRAAATKANCEDWGFAGPHDAGHYNSKSGETGFFNCESGTFDSEYGRFFLNWYSGMLVRHADRVLSAVSQALHKSGRPKILKSKQIFKDGSVVHNFTPSVSLGVKLAGVHWWFKTRSHAAELTAGYYNTETRDGYAPIMEILCKHNALLSFTCVEMRDCEHPPESMCSPQGLLKQVTAGAKRARIPLSGENALQRYDEYAFSRITESVFGEKSVPGSLQQVTFLRMGGLMFDNWQAFEAFIHRMRTRVLN